MKINLNHLTLVQGNASCEAPEKLRIQGSKDIHLASLIGATEVSIYDRGNLKTTLTFNVTREHPSSEQAAQYVIEHASKVAKEQGILVIQLEDTANTTYILHDATVKSVSSHPDGTNSHHSYEIIGNKLENSIS